MSKKHVEKYYNQVCDQYHTFIEQLKVFDVVPNKLSYSIMNKISAVMDNFGLYERANN